MTTNERNTMEHVSIEAYNPHAFITLRKINPESNDSMFIMHKATELEETLDRIKNLEKLIEITQNQIGQVLGNMTSDGWYSSDTDKSEVLSDLCDIFDHEAKQEIRVTGTMTFELRYDCPLDEVEDFDARYFAQDNLSLDSYNGNIIVESFDVEDADVDW
jgi:hypothetical protein